MKLFMRIIPQFLIISFISTLFLVSYSMEPQNAEQYYDMIGQTYGKPWSELNQNQKANIRKKYKKWKGVKDNTNTKPLEHEEKSDPTVKEEKRESEQIEHHEKIVSEIALAKGMSPDKVIEFLNQGSQSNFLKRIVEVIFKRDKNEQYTIEKICSHNTNVVDQWKILGTKPAGLSRDQWKGMKNRKSLCLFTVNNPYDFFENKLNNPSTIKVEKLEGDSKAIVISAIWNVDREIGEEYIDNRVQSRFRRIKELSILNANENLDQIIKTDMNKIMVRIVINSLVDDIADKGHLPKNEDIFKTFSINTICPAY